MSTTPDDASNAWAVPAFKAEVFQPASTNYVVIIPVINEGERIRTQLREMLACEIYKLADIVIVDGGSTDNSLDQNFLSEMKVRALVTKLGPGRLSAQLRCGYAWALTENYTGIITIDGNGKDGVETIPNFVTALDEGYGYVQASRFLAGGHSENTPLARLVAIRLLHAPILSIGAGHWFTDTTQGYRAYSADYLKDPRTQPFRDIFVRYELLAYLTVRASQLGYRVTELPTRRIYPKGETIPTKISSFDAWVDLLSVVLKAAFGGFNPRHEA